MHMSTSLWNIGRGAQSLRTQIFVSQICEKRAANRRLALGHESGRAWKVLTTRSHGSRRPLETRIAGATACSVATSVTGTPCKAQGMRANDKPPGA